MHFTDPTAARIIHESHHLEARQSRRRRVRSEPTPMSGRVTAALQRRRDGARSGESWIENHELFAGLTAAARRRLGGMLTILDVPAGRMLGRQGRLANEFVAIVSGGIGVTIDGVPHAVLDDGSHFGAIPLLDAVPGAPHVASFDVVAPSRIAVASPAEFRAIMSDFPVVSDRVMAMTVARLAYLTDLRTASVPARRTEVPASYPVHVSTWHRCVVEQEVPTLVS